MAQFDVYKNTNAKTKKYIPFLLDIQNEILNNLQTRVVVPLVLDMKAVKILNPIFKINNLHLTMSTAELAGVNRDKLGTKVYSLEDKKYEIIEAIDFMVTGF